MLNPQMTYATWIGVSVWIASIAGVGDAAGQTVLSRGDGRVEAEVPREVVVRADGSVAIELERIVAEDANRLLTQLPSRVALVQEQPGGSRGTITTRKISGKSQYVPSCVVWDTKMSRYRVEFGRWGPVGCSRLPAGYERIVSIPADRSFLQVLHEDPRLSHLRQEQAKERNFDDRSTWNLTFLTAFGGTPAIISRAEAIAVNVRSRIQTLLANNPGSVFIAIESDVQFDPEEQTQASTSIDNRTIAYRNVVTLLQGFASVDNEGFAEETWYANLPPSLILDTDDDGFSGFIETPTAIDQKWFGPQPVLDASITFSQNSKFDFFPSQWNWSKQVRF